MRFSRTLHNHLSLNGLQHPRVIKHATFHIQHEITRISLCERYAFALRYMVFRNREALGDSLLRSNVAYTGSLTAKISAQLFNQKSQQLSSWQP